MRDVVRAEATALAAVGRPEDGQGLHGVSMGRDGAWSTIEPPKDGCVMTSALRPPRALPSSTTKCQRDGDGTWAAIELPLADVRDDVRAEASAFAAERRHEDGHHLLDHALLQERLGAGSFPTMSSSAPRIPGGFRPPDTP